MITEQTKHIEEPAEYGARFEETQMEVGTGEPGYKWVPAVYVITPTGAKLYPPMTRREAVAFCKREGWRVIAEATGGAR